MKLHSFNGFRGFRFKPLIFFVASLIANAANAGWQDSPDTLQLQPVGTEMRLNGVPMKIRHFMSDQPAEQLIKQFQEVWERGNVRGSVTKTKLNEWIVLNQSLGDEHRSVQVRETIPGQIEGYIALTSPKQAQEPVLQFRLPLGLEPVSIVESKDPGKSSQQVTAVSRRSVDITASTLESTLRANGWKVQERKKTPAGTRLAADKGTQDFDAVLTPDDGGAIVVMNTVTMSKR